MQIEDNGELDKQIMLSIDNFCGIKTSSKPHRQTWGIECCYFQIWCINRCLNKTNVGSAEEHCFSRGQRNSHIKVEKECNS